VKGNKTESQRAHHFVWLKHEKTCIAAACCRGQAKIRHLETKIEFGKTYNLKLTIEQLLGASLFFFLLFLLRSMDSSAMHEISGLCPLGFSDVSAKASAVLQHCADLPRGPIEPSSLDLVVTQTDTDELHAIVCAPPALEASDVVVVKPPVLLRPGQLCVAHVTISPSYFGPETDKDVRSRITEVAMRMLTSQMDFTVSVVPSICGSPASHALTVTVRETHAPRALELATLIPASASDGDVVLIGAIAYTGRLALGPLCRIPVIRAVGLTAPLMLELPRSEDQGSTDCNAVVSDSGVLYVGGVMDRTEVCIFSRDGTKHPSFTSPRISIHSAVAVDSLQQLLFLCDRSHGNSTSIVAIDPHSFEEYWVSVELFYRCYCLCALPRSGVVVGSSDGSSELHVLRAADGYYLATAACPESVFLAADDCTATVYVSSDIGHVDCYKWDADGVCLNSLGRLRQVPFVNEYRPLAIVPPSPGHLASHLVVAALNHSELYVLSLPGCEFVGHVDPGCGEVDAVAADASGTSIVVVSDGFAHVLPWPLTGLPPLG
jgi:hypothetical protein